MDCPQAAPMSYDNRLSIERHANGYGVTVKDPAIVKANQSNTNSKTYKPYRDPERCYVFKTVAEVNAFLTENLDKALPKPDAEDSFESAFDKAADAASKEKD